MLTKIFFPPNKTKIGKYVCLFVATLLVLPAGTMYAFGAISTQLANDLNVRSTKVDRLGSAGDLGVYLGIFIGIFWDLCGSQCTTLASMILVSGGYLLNYLTVQGSFGEPVPFGLLYVSFWMVGQGSYGMFVNGLSTTIRNFETRHRGKIVGYFNALYGVSAVIFTALYQHVLKENVANYFLLICIVSAAVNVLAFFFMEELYTVGWTRWCIGPRKRRTGYLEALLAWESDEEGALEDAQQASLGDDEAYRMHVEEICAENEEGFMYGGGGSAIDYNSFVEEERTVSPLRLGEIEDSGASGLGEKFDRALQYEREKGIEATGLRLLRKPEFYLIFLGFFMVSGSGLMWKNIVGSVDSSFSLSDNTASNMVMLWSLVNAGSRLVAGLLSDYTVPFLPRPFWMLLATIVMLGSHLTYLFYNGTISLWIVDIGTGIGYGFAFAIFNGLIVIYYGVNHVGLNLGFVSLAPAAGGALLTFASTKMTDNVTQSDLPNCFGWICYRDSFTLSSSCLVLGLWIVLILTYVHYRTRFFRGHPENQVVEEKAEVLSSELPGFTFDDEDGSIQYDFDY